MKSRKAYFFRCRKCGEYRTTAKTFQKFCPEKAWQAIQNRQDAAGGLIEFESGCPKCTLDGKTNTKIILLKPKRQTIN